MPFANPTSNLQHLNLREGSHVADFGAGSGFYSLALAFAVGHTGKVYVVDIQKELLLDIQKRAVADGFDNVEIIWGDLEIPGGSKLADASVDAVVVSNILFQADNKRAIAEEATRVLKPGSQVMIIDWSDSFGNMGPQATQVVPEPQAKQLFGAAGLMFEKSFSAGDHHYGLIFKKP